MWNLETRVLGRVDGCESHPAAVPGEKSLNPGICQNFVAVSLDFFSELLSSEISSSRQWSVSGQSNLFLTLCETGSPPVPRVEESLAAANTDLVDAPSSFPVMLTAHSNDSQFRTKGLELSVSDGPQLGIAG
jgi:hypothetical protein